MKIVRIPLVIILLIVAGRGFNAGAQTETTLYTFGTIGSFNDGYYPFAGLVQGRDGNFYGTTEQGGTNGEVDVGDGTVFRINPSGVYTSLYSFGSSTNDGANPYAGLVQGSDGNFYGTTYYGGTNDNGTVFRISPSGSETVLYQFGPSTQGIDNASGGSLSYAAGGANPAAGLVQGSDSNFYGTTSTGGNCYNCGTVFRISPSGAYTNLYFFGSSTNDGAYPLAGLVQGSDGNFYGTTYYGGTNYVGTVFRISPSGSETVLYQFGGSPTDGYGPQAGLVQGSDGNFYGTTYYGGTNYVGTVFQISPSGAYTNLYSFGSSPTDGYNPQAGLVQGSDGNFYGTTSQGGTNFDLNSLAYDFGTIFRISPSGVYTSLFSFDSEPNGEVDPVAGLVQGSDGSFYGTTSGGGPQGGPGGVFQGDGYLGTIFKLSVLTGQSASTNSWLGGNGKWETAGDWSEGTAPSVGDALDLITNAGVNTVTIDATTAGSFPGTMTISNLILAGVAVVDANTLALSNAGTNTPLHILGSLSVSNAGGAITISNSALRVDGGPFERLDGDLTLDSGAFDVGTNELRLATVHVPGFLGGKLHLNGGVASMGTLTLSTAGGAPASVTMNGGILNVAGAIRMGTASVGFFTLNAGTVEAGNVFVSLAVLGGLGGQLTEAGGSILVSNLLQIGTTVGNVGSVTVSGGTLAVTNASQTAVLDVEDGTVTMSGGIGTVDGLSITNVNGRLNLNAGTFNSRAAAVTNAITFFVGDGTNAATYHLLGGIHSFADGLEVRNQGTISGCGTISGTVVVDPGGMVLADCGGVLTFTGNVTNNGLMRAVNGSVLEAYGPVVNNGIIDIETGSTNFHSGYSGTGVVVDASFLRVTSLTRQINDLKLTWTSVGGRSYVVQTNAPPAGGNYTNGFMDLSPMIPVPGAALGTTNYLDVGGATNFPARYYRIRLLP